MDLNKKGMKSIILIITILLLGITWNVNAQGIFGFFHQQAKKKKLMAAQVAALLVYDNQNKSGYAINENGINAAHLYKRGELIDHKQYYLSLLNINQSVGAKEKTKVIIEIKEKIIDAFMNEADWQKRHKDMRSKELEYLGKVASGIQEKVDADIKEMQRITTPGQFNLTDADRLDRLDKLIISMKDKLAFTMSFTAKCRKVALLRQAQMKDQDQLKKIYGN
jgi:hypothetical protein